MRHLSMLAAVAAVSVLPLTGCGVLGSGGSAQSAKTSLAPGKANSGESGAAKNGSTAKAGDTFRLGQQARLAYDGATEVNGTTAKGTVLVTVRAIQRGTVSDLRRLGLGDVASTMVPYYIRATMT